MKPNSVITPPYQPGNLDELKEERSGEVEAANAVVTGEGHKSPRSMDPRFVIDWIGHIPYAAFGQHYSHCKFIAFEDEATATGLKTAADLANDFFRDHQNLLMVDKSVSADGSHIMCLVTNTLTDDQLEIVNTRAHIIEAEVQKKLEEKQAALEEKEALVVTEEKRLRELADVGTKCLANHGAVVKQLRKGKK